MAEIQKYFRFFLAQMKTFKSAFKFNWPLRSYCLIYILCYLFSSFFRAGNKQPHTEAFRILARRVFCVSQFWGTAA